MIEKGTWVEIEKIVLNPEDRSNSIPEETKEKAMVMWMKGFTLQDSNISSKVKIKTITGRIEEGVITEVEPSYTHSFGKYVKEISFIGKQAKDILFEGGEGNE